MKYALIAVTNNGAELAAKLRQNLQSGDIYVKEGRHNLSFFAAEFAKMRDLVADIFYRYDALVFFTSTGIAVRYIAPWVKDKYTDSPVLVIDEKGQYVIPLLSGHVGGAVSLADEIAELLGAVSVHTTATDVQGKFAVDVFAKKNSLVITDREAAKNISAAVLNGEKIAFYIERTESEGLDNEARTVRVGGRLPKEIILCESERETESYDYRIIVRAASETNDQSIQSGTRQEICKMDSEKCTLILLLGNIAAGIGCREMITITDVPGIMLDVNNSGSKVDSLTLAEVDGLIADGTISGGMIPKVEACRKALLAGVSVVRMVNGKDPRSIITDIKKGVPHGTVITK